jgi:hypothetical protein
MDTLIPDPLVQIDIRPDGTVHCLYTDAIDLQAFGKVQVTRASNVEFEEGPQLWVARLPDGRAIGAARSRADCLKLEVAYLQERM